MQYMQAEQEKQEKEEKRKKETNRQIRTAMDTVNAGVKTTFEQTQQNRFEIEDLKRSLKRTRIIAIVALLASFICMAMVMSEGLQSLIATMP